MQSDQPLVVLDAEGAHVSAPPLRFAAASVEGEHGYGHVTAPLRQRGLECTVEYGLSDYIVHVGLPDGSALIISPPQEPSTEHPPGYPESWLVTRGHPDDSTVHEVIYDSEPDGPHAQHGGSVPSLLAAIDSRLDQLSVTPRAAMASPRASAARARSPTAQRTMPAPQPAASAARPALPPVRPHPFPVADRFPSWSPPWSVPPEPSRSSTAPAPELPPDGSAMPSHYDVLPDLAFGRHPVYGIVAANPKNLAASTWMLKGFDFHPVPDQPTLYALANQNRDGEGRTTRAVELLRRAGYRVDVDAALGPSLVHDAAPIRSRGSNGEPDVAIAEHPQLGIVAATSDHSSSLSGRLVLEEHGWRLNPDLDIYTLPTTVGRSEALEKVANATVSMHRSDLQVAVQPRLAQDVAARRPPAPAPDARHERGQGLATHRFPVSAAALAASPARAGVPGKAPAVSAPAARPVDPRIAFSRNR